MTQAGTVKTWGHGKKTQNAGTLINVLVPPWPKKKSKLTYFEVTTGATAHTMTVLRPLNKVSANADAASGQAVLVLTADPGSYSSKRTANNLIAANDYLVYKCADGTYVFDIVSSVVTNADNTVSATMTTNLPTLGVKKGAPVWFLGIITDTDPNSYNAEAHPTFTLAASGVNSKRASEGSIVETHNFYEPMLIQIDNATNASVIESLQAVYGP